MIGLAIVAGAGIVGWTLLFRPIKVEVAHSQPEGMGPGRMLGP
jgi:hypothetical protein